LGEKSEGQENKWKIRRIRRGEASFGFIKKKLGAQETNGTGEGRISLKNEKRSCGRYLLRHVEKKKKSSNGRGGEKKCPEKNETKK